MTIPMTASMAALIGFAVWTLLLLGGIVGLRSALTLSGQRAPNSFKPDGSDVSAFSGRLCRAQANCLENLPVFASLVLVAAVTGQSGITDPLAGYSLGARIAQSTVHMISTSPQMVMVRVTFFLTQFSIMAWWAFSMLRAWT